MPLQHDADAFLRQDTRSKFRPTVLNQKLRSNYVSIHQRCDSPPPAYILRLWQIARQPASPLQDRLASHTYPLSALDIRTIRRLEEVRNEVCLVGVVDGGQWELEFLRQPDESIEVLRRVQLWEKVDNADDTHNCFVAVGLYFDPSTKNVNQGLVHVSGCACRKTS